jgi:hypothetical protein
VTGELEFRAAIREAIIEEMERDESVVLFGEDVAAEQGGVFAAGIGRSGQDLTIVSAGKGVADALEAAEYLDDACLLATDELPIPYSPALEDAFIPGAGADRRGCPRARRNRGELTCPRS